MRSPLSHAQSRKAPCTPSPPRPGPHRRFKKESSLSKELAQRKGVLDSEGYQAWVAAREAKDWSLFAPKLQEWLNLTREMCAAVDPSKPAYDVALDDYEKGMTSERLDAVFAVRSDSHASSTSHARILSPQAV